MGARPLKRYIQDKIEGQIAKEIIEGNLKSGSEDRYKGELDNIKVEKYAVIPYNLKVNIYNFNHGCTTKRRISKGRKNGRRRAQDGLKVTSLSKCPKCGNMKRAHFECPSCGFYKEIKETK